MKGAGDGNECRMPPSYGIFSPLAMASLLSFSFGLLLIQ